MLSLKGKDYQYDELYSELNKVVRDRGNHMARVEIMRIKFEHKTDRKQYESAQTILTKCKDMFTDQCIKQMIRQLPGAVKT